MSELLGVDLINKSVNKWNAWFEDQYNSEHHYDLKNARILEKDLRGIILSGVDLRCSDLMKSNFSSVYLGNTLLDSSNFSDCDLSLSNFCSGTFSDIVFNSVRAEGINFAGVTLSEVDFQSASLTESQFSGTKIREGCFNSTILVKSQFNGAVLAECTYISADFSNAQLNGAVIENCDFSSAQLQNAELASTTFKDSKLIGANMSGADLRGAKLNYADLQNVNLENADLTSAELEHADLRLAKNYILNSTYIRNARFSVNARDPWSVLRRTYTGPAMVWTIFALIAATLPYGMKALYWTAINSYQAQSGITLTCEAHRCYSILQVLLGFDKYWLYIVIPSVLFFYNIFRGLLTFMVGLMRAEEERSGYSPQWSGNHFWQGYKPLYNAHRILNIIKYIAVAVFIFNIYHWATRLVYISG